MPRSRSRSRSSTASSRRSRSPLSDHDRPNEFRIHIADLPRNVQEQELRKAFERYGTMTDLWVATASGFGFAVYKYKDDAQKAIDQMDGRSFGTSHLKVTWARPRQRNRSNRHDPNMRCYKCGQRGHFSRECEQKMAEERSSHRRPLAPRSRYHSRSRSPIQLPLPGNYFPHALPPMYPPPMSRYYPRYYPMMDRSNGHEHHRYRDRPRRITPPSTSARYSRR